MAALDGYQREDDDQAAGAGKTSDCPGRHKCHGPAQWCPECGDVDLVCDDPACWVHRRGDELRDEWCTAEIELKQAEYAFLNAKKKERAAWVRYRVWETGNPVMVARRV